LIKVHRNKHGARQSKYFSVIFGSPFFCDGTHEFSCPEKLGIHYISDFLTKRKVIDSLVISLCPSVCMSTWSRAPPTEKKYTSYFIFM